MVLKTAFTTTSLDVQHRSNITLARLQDESRVEIETISSSRPRGLLAKGSPFLNVVELFAGTLDGKSGGLMHKQQQLANAVCPLVSKAIAEYLLDL